MAQGRLESITSLNSSELHSAPENGAVFSSEEDDTQELIMTPTDELTGLPLPVLVNGADYTLPGSLPRRTNYHHHFHPQKSRELGFDEAGNRLPKTDPQRVEGLALRFSRGQQLPVWLHDRYHDIFQGPQLPEASRDKFTRVILACAGVVPVKALDLSEPGKYREVSLNSKQHEFIRRRIYFEGAASKRRSSKRSHIGKYIAEYSLQNSLDPLLSETEIRKRVKEFLKPRSQAQRVHAGRFILGQVVDASLDSLVDIHNEAKREGMAKKGKKSLGEIALKFFTIDRFQDYFDPLEERLQGVF
jgi:hypothetical protein